ncbi:M56 family metallopeptidase [Dinghuibacter silviterrae]|uniref:BlaR1 peptidase M56 n=1 Tax=Dinghuibacter silviterrae TaxID=1539049 RepID=A0A4R8DFG3_9BACT|nr:M56 family metallopeptidase [Dinghuibacter silviterrae]TDW96058.1 BlaR1 peptidase M56 [Dinghuibacter silviterrae]
MNLLSYSLQAGIGLLLTYVFYQAFLLRLTFYKANRLFLAGSILLCLLLPLLNTSGLWPEKVEHITFYMQTAPVAAPVLSPARVGPIVQATPHRPWPLYFLLAGMTVMLLRLLFQTASLIRIRRKATLVARNGRIRLMALPYPLAPFSFGHSIFFHPSVQTSEDFHRIVEHETAHINQRHTLDIFLCQVLLIMQWWNPAAWLLDQSVRQNLEFLADQNVLEGGADPRQYQYLLLRVSGIAGPVLSNPFNFSPLKKRIAMMNKQRSGRRQGTRFLFALPLLLLLLAAASRHRIHPQDNHSLLRLYGFTVYGATLRPLEGATIYDKVSGRSVRSDGKGFFMLTIPFSEPTDTANIRVLAFKEGYDTGYYTVHSSLKTVSKQAGLGASLLYIGLTSLKPDKNASGFVDNTVLFPEQERALKQMSSPARKDIFDKFFKDTAPPSRSDIEKVFASSPDQIYFVIDGKSYAVVPHASASFDTTVDLFLVDEKTRMTGEEVNKMYKRSQLQFAVGSFPAGNAENTYGIDENLFVIKLKAPQP